MEESTSRKKITFHQLHAVIQNVFNWENYYLHKIKLEKVIDLDPKKNPNLIRGKKVAPFEEFLEWKKE